MDSHYHPSFPPFYTPRPPPVYPPGPLPPQLHQIQTMSMESLGGYQDYNDSSQSTIPSGQMSNQQRQRRKQPQSAEHIKHRRTRSGCYTCRHRRVKCDETRPICDRCRKGNRDCSYPGSSTSPTISAGRSSRNSSQVKSEDASSGSEGDTGEDSKSPLAAILDEEEPSNDSEPPSATSDIAKPSEAPFATSSRPHSSATGRLPAASSRDQPKPRITRTVTKHAPKSSISQNNKWASLPKDLKVYLRYHQESLSHHHYGFKYDAMDFLKTTFLEIALNDESEALLYGVAAFSAYHHAIQKQESMISRFLAYYNKSITLLQQSLMKRRHSIATLLTILQLATIEEFLGDWTNLLGHQRAAHQILTDLFTPQTIMQDETRRRIIAWYIRFDLFAGLMGGGETNLPREWFASCADFYSSQARDRPSDLAAKFEGWFSSSRLLATDVTLLTAAKSRGTISDEAFEHCVRSLDQQFNGLRNEFDTAFEGPSCFAQGFARAPSPNSSEITNFRDPHFLYAGELFTMNYVLIDFWAIELTFQLSLASARRVQPPAYLRDIALKKCKIFEAIQYYDGGPPGALLGCQASLGIACLCLPYDEQHINWSREKFALMERNGYIYPAALRHRMSDLWGIDVSHWWLPNDRDCPGVVRAIREFVEYRASMPQDAMAADVRDMSGIFRKMRVTEDPGIPEDLRGFATDSDAFDPPLQWESSPED